MDSLESIKNCLDTGKSFILEAGAGSGKTWTLIESLKYIIEKNGRDLERRSKRIACITYTNVAKDEISERIDNNPLVLVSTIHEFLWFTIKHYQKELKLEIIQANHASAKGPIPELDSIIEKVTIEYSQYGRNFEKGQLTHEDIIEFSHRIFLKYPKICGIVTQQFPYIFVDEYQDTEPRTVEILLNGLLKPKTGYFILGFFGDFMQKIYNQGVGKIQSEQLQVITKKENYRCSRKVIDLLSLIRPDLKQEPAGANKEGEITFITCQTPQNNDFEKTVQYLTASRKWDIENNGKILFLTHKGIAQKLGYENLLSCYGILPFGRDRLLSKEERFCDFFLNKVEMVVRSYANKNFPEMIRLLGSNGTRINSHADKKQIDTLIRNLIEIRKTASVKAVLDFVVSSKLMAKPQRLIDFEFEIQRADLDEKGETKKKFYESLIKIPYQEFITINEFIDDFTPYSTKHGVKGAEFDNVLVVIDDSSWNQFKFNDVFANNLKNAERFNRTLNLLYVCCSRAKDKLTILSLSSMDSKAMATIIQWFKSENVIDASDLPLASPSVARQST